jgi:molybdopterin-containing oxidoreductase family iron-sulfur binding subunit
MLAGSLRQAGSRGLVVAGLEQPPAVQALAHAANVALGSAGHTVRFIEPVMPGAPHMDSLSSLADDMESGRVSCLLMVDANPVYHAPGDMDFASLMQRVSVTIHAGFNRDESAALSTWHLPLLHPLESWGDARAFDGTASLGQPTTMPLAPALSREQVLGALAATGLEARDVVREHWREVWGEADFEAAWHSALVAGVIPDTAAEARNVTAPELGGWLGPAARRAADRSVRPRSLRPRRRLCWQ